MGKAVFRKKKAAFSVTYTHEIVLEHDHIRIWKHAFDGVDVEHPHEPPRKELRKIQKAWLIRAWTAQFGFVPDAVPRFNEQQGWFHVPAIEVQWNHILVIGEVHRLDGQDWRVYNVPTNLVPLSKIHHIGSVEEYADEYYVTHPDTQEANRNWGLFKQGKVPNPYYTMGQERITMTENGLKYHDDALDSYFSDLASLVVYNYHLLRPDDLWPPSYDKP